MVTSDKVREEDLRKKARAQTELVEDLVSRLQGEINLLADLTRDILDREDK